MCDQPITDYPAKNMNSKQSGSALIVAVIFSMLLSMVAVTMLKLASHEYKSTHWTVENNSLFYLAEGYIDQAMWAINNNDWETDNWQAINNQHDRYKHFAEIPIGDTRVADIRVIVKNVSYADYRPVIICEAVSSSPTGRTLSKQLKVTVGALKPTGLITRNTMKFSGRGGVDSYNSKFGPPDPFLNRGDKVIVGTVSQAVGAIKSTNPNFEVYGYVATGKEPIVWAGEIYGADSPGGGGIDPDRLLQDFSNDFPDVVEPDWTGAITTLPAEISNIITLGDPASTAPMMYDVSELKLAASTKLLIVGPVLLHIEKEIFLGGSAAIEVAFTGSVEIYTPGTITTTGGGLINITEQPSKFKVFGTAKAGESQSITLVGGAGMAAVIYAPNADIAAKGNGDYAGSIICNSVRFSGNASFHYDESLTQVGGGIGGWYELVRSEHRLNFQQHVTNKGGSY
ncbi:MAG: hypothetical protein ACI81V_000665 [Lentimonas sp.]|jgi:hypothetical protein